MKCYRVDVASFFYGDRFVDFRAALVYFFRRYYEDINQFDNVIEINGEQWVRVDYNELFKAFYKPTWRTLTPIIRKIDNLVQRGVLIKACEIGSRKLLVRINHKRMNRAIYYKDKKNLPESILKKLPSKENGAEFIKKYHKKRRKKRKHKRKKRRKNC